MNIVQVHPSVHRIETPYGEGWTVFLYLVKGDSLALVDTGTVHSPHDVLQPALAQLGMALSDVDLILSTHAHMDHVGGNLEMKRISNAAIHVHSADLFMARSTEAQVEFFTAPMLALELPEQFVRARGDHVRQMVGEPAGADVVLSGGETLDLGAGVKLQVVHNPGHTPGCVSYYWESEGLLITGDAVQGHGTRPGVYPLYFDAADYRRSLVALSELDFRLLCMEHGYAGGTVLNEPTRNRADGHAIIAESIKAADTIHAAVVGALRQRPGATKREVALAALDELLYQIPQVRVRETNMPLCVATLATHIDVALAGTYPA